LKIYWNHFQKSFNQLELRERKLVFITCVIIVLGIFVLLVWQPLLQKWHVSTNSSGSLIQQANVAKNAINVLKANAVQDVNQPYKEKITALQIRLKVQQQKIDTITSALISPKNMPEVFSKLLNRNDLTLESISNADAEPVNISTNGQEDSLLFKHGLLLEMKGQFLSGLNYIKQMEKQDWQLYWDELSYTSHKYPNGVLTLKVHTLSTSDSVLEL